MLTFDTATKMTLHKHPSPRQLFAGLSLHLTFVFSVFLACCVPSATAMAVTPPNIVLILADDLGYGDVQPLNPGSRIATPAFNRLAKEGLTFTDAHTPSAVCTPTRYGLITGRYCWRTHLKRGVINGYGKPLIEPERPTLGSIFSAAGYRTTVIGKWHLGLGLHGGPDDLDLSKPLSHHPGTVGFQESLVIPASLDFPPYVYFRNGNATTTQTIVEPKRGFPQYLRQGPRAKDFDIQGCLDRLIEETVEVVETMKSSDQPTLLYLPLTAPHKPVYPSAEFAGTTGLGPYGDFVRQVDGCVGRVIDALDSNGVLDDSIVIVTSDNGSFMRRYDDETPDHVDDETVQAYRSEHHTSNAQWRGTKADIWEGGHRVPFFVRLPNGRHSGQRIDQVIGLVDILATLADKIDIKLPVDAAPDSVSFASLLEDPKVSFHRPPLICHSSGGMFAIRDGNWKLVAGNGSGGRQQPKGKPFAEPWMLVNLDEDPQEKNNVADAHPRRFERMKRQLLDIKGDD
ncbi:sulfatase family protein [Roseiconus lacunae]|uniref:sulfatase family protein n=1 Tax=Roseiconus lacunae TaxID=2605694 RepID=UPI001E3C8FFA|nr:arylsulfatase [Roseiconus lacunae]MCD0458216.1 arylsulfatase [Roseiconus lacunae]